MAVAVYPLMVQDALMVIDSGDVPQVLIADSAKVTFALTVVVEEPVAEPLFSSSYVTVPDEDPVMVDPVATFQTS